MTILVIEIKRSPFLGFSASVTVRSGRKTLNCVESFGVTPGVAYAKAIFNAYDPNIPHYPVFQPRPVPATFKKFSRAYKLEGRDWIRLDRKGNPILGTKPE